MGASEFFTKSVGRNAKSAFNRAQEEASYDHGHDGYSGTIAEKDSFITIEMPSATYEHKDAYEYADSLLEKDDKRIADKWGPAGCIFLGINRNGDKEYLFFGWASS